MSGLLELAERPMPPLRQMTNLSFVKGSRIGKALIYLGKTII